MVLSLIGKFITIPLNYYRYLYVKKISNDNDGFQYECIDGNHRLAVFQELGLESYSCIVLPEALNTVEYFIIANGKFTFLSLIINRIK